ncbi:hypothetical protein B0O80DRAFT_454169 [Mortierella sp. GBAus27b]|nr:hypothetical protein B0O80DRAFT_454169 [Mortierella sp. GBAus27b]
MLDIPEIDELICQGLGPHDLLQCVLVNKKWNAAIIPYLWRNLSFLRNGHERQQDAFHRLLLEDYLQTQQLDQCPNTTEQPELSTSFTTTLARYGCLIQMLPGQLWDYHNQVITSRSRSSQRQPAVGQEISGATQLQLSYHLYRRRCPSAQISFFGVTYRGSDPGGWNEHLGFLVPRVRQLYVETIYIGPHPEFSRLKNLLDLCTTTLEVLYLRVQIGQANTHGVDDEERVENEPTDWTSLKKLSLMLCSDYTRSKAFWTWLWKRCYHIERLDVWSISGPVESLAQGMAAHMCNLVEISLGQKPSEPTWNGIISEDWVATLLSGSQKGWRVVEIKESASFGRAAKDALQMHVSTLEEFLLVHHGGIETENPVQVLSSCPVLKTFVLSNILTYGRKFHSPHFEAKAFIDQDPASASLWTWACEGSLRVLKIMIVKIPRPDVGNCDTKEPYFGQGREIQMLVYERLARLTNLETLWLGKGPHVTDHDRYARWEPQSDCLEMSLESGLHKLSGLKKLKELSVENLTTRIGVMEVQWMTEHWPQLHAIHGLCEDGEQLEAVQWLREHHPKIHLGRHR